MGRSFDDDKRGRVAAGDLTAKGMIEVIELRNGLSVQATSFVGRVNLGGLQITIRPKIDVDVLRTLFRYAYGLRNLTTLTVTPHALETGGFQDLLIVQLAAEVSELLARGLHRTYVPLAEELASPRGRIDLQRLAQQGGLVAAAIPCLHHPRREDTPVNRILLAGLTLAATLTDDLLLRTRIRRLAAILADGVTPVALSMHTLRTAQRRLNRLTTAYAPAFALIALLLAGSGMTLEDERTSTPLPGFLFDMNLFFEALLTRFLTINLVGYQVRSQVRLRDMMRYAPEANPLRRQPPTPRPDIVVEKAGQVVAMLDTKYRDLWAHALPREMLYQLAIYALSREQQREAVILYPTTGGSLSDQIVEIREPSYGNPRARVILRAVNLLELSNAIEGSGVHGDRWRQQLAEQLALGSHAVVSWYDSK